MSHHHQKHYEPAGQKPAEPLPKPMIPLFEKNDLTFLALIKPLLSPNGQNLVDLILILGGSAFQDNPLDIPGLLSQLNLPGDNNSTKELLFTLLNSINNQENKTNPNLAMLNVLLNSLNQKEKPEDS